MVSRFSTAINISAKIRMGTLSSVELLSRVIAQIQTLSDAINAVVVSEFDRPLNQAKAADKKRSRLHADERHHTIRLAWRRFFRSYNVVLCPVPLSQAFEHNLEIQRESRRIEINEQSQDYNSLLFSPAIAGLNYLPITARPIEFPNEMPIRIQVVGPHLEDVTTLRFAEVLDNIHPRPICPHERKECDEASIGTVSHRIPGRHELSKPYMVDSNFCRIAD